MIDSRDINRRFAERVALRRRELGLTQLQLSIRLQLLGRAGMEPQRVQEIEAGRRRYYQLADLVALARALDVPLGWLISGDSGTD